MATTMGPARLANPAFQVYGLLRLGFTVAPILFGLDKFFNFMVYWPRYLAPWLDGLLPGTTQQVMYGVGVVEIVAGLVVAIAPRFGGYLVAAWLAGIIINLLTYAPPLYYDIALRDLGLMLGAMTLGRLAWAFKGQPTETRDQPAETEASRQRTVTTTQQAGWEEHLGRDAGGDGPSRWA